jgi:hypothetical protein
VCEEFDMRNEQANMLTENDQLFVGIELQLLDARQIDEVL